MQFWKQLWADKSNKEGQSRIAVPAGISFRVLAMLFAIGVGLTVADVYIVERSERWAPSALGTADKAASFERDIVTNLLQHLASALIVASIMGFTYEWLLYRRREEEKLLLIKQGANEHSKAVKTALETFAALTPVGIFRLLEEIARQTRTIPTLYEPAREDGNEFTFAKSRDLFERLIHQKRPAIVAVLEEWIASGLTNLMFLASDFIGEYRLEECADTLRERAKNKLKNWKHESEEVKSWTLNYVWAASRCEKQKYAWLGEVLNTTDDDFVRKWILFVPLQMQDSELCDMIEGYLQKRSADISVDHRLHVIKALAALGNNGNRVRASAIVKKFNALFCEQSLRAEINSGAWAGLPIPRELKVRKS